MSAQTLSAEARLRKDLQNDADTHAAVTESLGSKIVAQKKNTRKAYATGHRLWREFCKERGFQDGELVSEPKAFPDPTDDNVAGRAIVLPIDPDVQQWSLERQIPAPELLQMIEDDREAVNGVDAADVPRNVEQEGSGALSYKTVEGYVTAIAELHETQRALKQPVPESFRGAALKAMLEGYRRQTDARARENYVDRGADGITNGYTDEEQLTLHTKLLSQSRDANIHLRTHLDILLGHFLVTRGETRRNAELPDLAPLLFPPSEGPTPCLAVVLVMAHGKTNKYGWKQHMGAIRHKEWRLCTLFALAHYFFFRWEINGEGFPNFSTRQKWYDIKILLGKTSAKQWRIRLSWTLQMQPSSKLGLCLRRRRMRCAVAALGQQSFTAYQNGRSSVLDAGTTQL